MVLGHILAVTLQGDTACMVHGCECTPSRQAWPGANGGQTGQEGKKSAHLCQDRHFLLNVLNLILCFFEVNELDRHNLLRLFVDAASSQIEAAAKMKRSVTVAATKNTQRGLGM